MSQPQVHEYTGNEADPLFLPTGIKDAEIVAQTPITPEVVEEKAELVEDEEDDLDPELEAALLGLNDEDEDTEADKDAADKTKEATAEQTELTKQVTTVISDVFGDVFQEKFGVSVEEAKAILEGASHVVQKDSVVSQEQELKTLWGDAYESNFDAVIVAWQKLPDALKAKYDNAEGAKKIFKSLNKGQPVQTPSTAKPARETTKFMGGRSTVKSTPTERATAPAFKLSEILAMPKADYNKQASAIAQAFAEGRVVRDVE